MTAATEKSVGLEGIVAADSAICDIDGKTGRLIYAGYTIQDLAENVSFEEVCYLLWNLELPNKAQLQTLKKELDREARLPNEFIAQLRLLLKTIPPMDALRSGVSLLSQFDSDDPDDPSEEAFRRRMIRLTARVPQVVAAFDRLRNGKEPVSYRSGLGFAESFLYHLNGEMPIPEAIQSIDKALVLHAEHSFNASTFAARVTLATQSDIYSAITSAVGTLKGPLHGGANERVILMLEKIESADDVEPWLSEQLSQKKRIFGFGHRVYKTLDPRAGVLKEMARKLTEATGHSKWYDISERLATLMKEKKGLEANVDFFSASVYASLGIATDNFTPIFAISRMSGWTAHLLEQWRNNRLIRPIAHYIGPADRQVKPIEQR